MPTDPPETFRIEYTPEFKRSLRRLARKLNVPKSMKNKPIARKSLVAAKPILKGEVFTEENLTVKRPGTGISPVRWDEMIGQVAQKTMKRMN